MTRATQYGFTPEVSIEQGVAETIDWYLENKELADAGKDVFKSLNWRIQYGRFIYKPLRGKEGISRFSKGLFGY